MYKIPQVWDLTRGSGVTVGVLDSGLVKQRMHREGTRHLEKELSLKCRDLGAGRAQKITTPAEWLDIS